MPKIRKGFTLVELLIVIVIIGILAAAMLLSSGSATDSAEASTIISDLRSLKSAALLLHADSMDDSAYISSGPTLELIARYSDNPQKYLAGTAETRVWAVVEIPNGSGNGRWYVRRHVADAAGVTRGVRARLTSRAESVGLVNNAGAKYGDAGGDAYVAMRIR